MVPSPTEKQQTEGLYFFHFQTLVFRGEPPFPPWKVWDSLYFSPASPLDGVAYTSTDVQGKCVLITPYLLDQGGSPSPEHIPITLPSSGRLFTVSDDIPRNSIPQPTRVVQVSCMATPRSALKSKGFSEVVIDTVLRAQQPPSLDNISQLGPTL